VLELARPPPGVAGKDAQTVERLEQIDGFVLEIDGSDYSGERGPTGQCSRRGGPGPARARTSDPPKAYNGVRCDGPTDVHNCGFTEDVGPSRHPRKRNCVTGRDVTGSVEDHSESALVVVVEKKDDAAGEIGIVKRWRSNQERTGERGIDHCSIMPTASRSRTSPNALRSRTSPNALRSRSSPCRNHGHQLTPMPSAMMWPHDVISSPLAMGQPRYAQPPSTPMVRTGRGNSPAAAPSMAARP
jgi:hypothetical protein